MLVDNKEHTRQEMHYDFNHEDMMKEIESYFNTENASERLLYPNLSMESPLRGSTINEKCIKDKILIKNKYKNNINILKDIRNCYETETYN